MENNRLLLIMNPNSGMKKGKKYLADILITFCANGYECTTYMTSKCGDATDYAREHCKDYDIVVCAGGDGTLNEVILGVLQSDTDIPIGYIPSGSTNDAAASMKLSTDMIQAAQDIVLGKPERIDVGKFNDDKCFSYIASFGAFTRVSYSTPQTIKNVFGHVAYILSGIKDVTNIVPIHVKIEADDKVYDNEYIFGAICNTTSVGGIINIDETLVDMSDGVFEVLLVKAPKNIVDVNNILRAITMKDLENDSIEFFKTEKAVITIEDEVDWTLDGEYEKGSSVVEMENMHKAISIIFNREK